MSLHCFSRQPIVDRAQILAGYELIYRDHIEAEHSHFHGHTQSAHDVFQAFSSIGDEDISGELPPFINISQDVLLVEDLYDLLPRNAVIEVVENTPFNKRVSNALIRLKAAGFQIALDDLQNHKEMAGFIELADIITLDVTLHGQSALEAQVIELGTNSTTLLAKKIETEEMLDHCLALPFELFQGYYLGRSEHINPIN